MIRSDLCDYSDAHIVVKGTIKKNWPFKNNIPFWSCIWKIDNTFIDNAKDLDIVMAICNLLEYSDSSSMT